MRWKMPRLIDADELKKAFVGYKYGTRAIEYYIDNAPTVDVVQCKDCIYYHKGDWYDDDVCKVHSNDDRGYCAWGERK